jgi:hypothetical protein
MLAKKPSLSWSALGVLLLQEVSVKLGLDYQKDDTTASVSYERIQSTNNKAHSNGIEGAVRWKF